MRQSNGQPGRWEICSTTIASAAVNRASTVWVGLGAEVSMLAPMHRLTDGSRRSLENSSGGTIPQVDAILASSSAASSYRRTT